MTKRFLKWYKEFGLMSDAWHALELWQYNRIQRIAWRAYKRGRYDERRKND